MAKKIFALLGVKTWSAELDIYGSIRNFAGRSLSDCPFRYQGQYEDEETGLYYNRFRYYSPNEGMYISQDPIRLAAGNPTLYGHVKDSNTWIDELGLYSELGHTGLGHHIFPRSIAKKLGIDDLSSIKSISWYPNKIKGSDTLHQAMHQRLTEAGIPFHGSKFDGSIDDAFKKMKEAYKDLDIKGFLKIPGKKMPILSNVTPLEAIEAIEKMYKEGKLPHH